MDADLRELKQAVQDLAIAVDEVVSADAALDAGDKARYRELNQRARERVKRVLLRLGFSAAGVSHIPSR